jgi:hypothetical protein
MGITEIIRKEFCSKNLRRSDVTTDSGGWEDNIKMYLRQIGCECVGLIV